MNQQKSKEEQKRLDIVLLSKGVKNKLKYRFKELNLKPSDVVKDAKERGMKTITKEKLSRYLNSDIPIHGFPTQKDVIWLCVRYGLEIQIKVNILTTPQEEWIEKANSLL